MGLRNIISHQYEKVNYGEIYTKSKLFDYIEVFYNRERKHSTLGYKSPLAFEEEQKAA